MDSCIKSVLKLGFLILAFSLATCIHAAGLPDLDPNNHYKLNRQLDDALSNYHQTLDKIVKLEPSWNNTIQPLQETTNDVVRTWSLIKQLGLTDEKTISKVTGFYRLAMDNPKLAQAYEKISLSAEFAKLERLQQLHIKQMLLYFKLSGANLDANKKARHWQLIKQLAELKQQLTENLRQDAQDSAYKITKDSDLSGIPQHYKTQLEKMGKIDLSMNNIAAIMMFAKNRELRHSFYNAFHSSNPSNLELITKMLKIRQGLADLLGYNNYAEYAVAAHEEPNSSQILQFLYNDLNKYNAKATDEIKILQNYAFDTDGVSKLEPWDLVYYAQRYKENNFKINTYALMQHFPLDQVLKNLFNLTEILYNLKINKQQDVYTIQNANSEIVGYFYLDLLTHAGKADGTFVVDYTSRLKLSDGKIQLPIVFINANFEGHGTDKLLNHYEIVNLYNSFGRMLTKILSSNIYLNLSGIDSLEQDSEELAASFTEQWVWHYFETILSKDIFEMLVAERDFNSGLSALFQTQTALLDFRLNLNSKADQDKSPLEILTEINQQPLVSPRLETLFSSDYKADFYVKLWAQNLADLCFAGFKPRHGINSKAGTKFLNSILSKGGQASTFNLSSDFLGQAPSL